MHVAWKGRDATVRFFPACPFSLSSLILFQTTYYAFTEALSNENMNSILTMDLSHQRVAYPHFDTLFLLLDRHSTGWNKTTLAFFDVLVQLGVFKQVQLVTFHPVRSRS